MKKSHESIAAHRGVRDLIHHLHDARDGVVEVFDLAGHPKTSRIYAWMHDTDDPANPKRHVTVLHVPPVISPQTAVKAAIVQEFKERASAN
jgi:hypothetical protein